MKQRTITGAAIVALLILVMFARQLTLYVFDAFIVCLAVLASFEMSNLLARQGMYNNKYFVIAYPILTYAIYLIGLLTDLELYMVVVLQAALIVLMLAAIALYGLINSKATKNEIETRRLKFKVENFAIFKSIHSMFAFFYPTVLMMAFVFLNNLPQMLNIFKDSALFLEDLSLFAHVIAFVIPIFTDTFAYLTGSLLKGPKLCPKISPNKTISGFIGGLVWGIAAAVGAFFIFSSISGYAEAFAKVGIEFWHLIILGAVGSVVSQIGDIFESYLKRKANVKDTGSLLAGHGGILDRMDSHIFCAPIIFIYFVIIL
ncbi:MAG: phosphatidate cytidylyltransferase, partial [Clostridia bacterium]|nr:phosphatidate cytidylyltransferase [Clostridia bacterium]